MGDLLRDLTQHSFLQAAVIAGLLASVSCGVVGTYVVTRRITYLAGAIAHCVLGGMGAVWFLRVRLGWTWLDPMHGAAAAALLAAVIVGLVSLRAKQREDTVIGAIWAIGTAVGVLFIQMTPGYAVDLTGYLFGNILMVGQRDLWLIAGLNAIVLGAVVAGYRPFLAICFDEEFARLRGVSVEGYYIALLCLTALTVVVLVKVVGIVMAIALLTLPTAIANHFGRSLWQLMALAAALCAIFVLSGLGVAYASNLPAGATIIVLAGSAYLLTAAGATLVRRGRH